MKYIKQLILLLLIAITCQKNYAQTTGQITPSLHDPLKKTEPIDKQLNETSFTNKWPLERCIEYAHHNNLQISEAELNERLAKLVWEQNKASRTPTLNGDASLGESYGRSIDPTSNQFVTKGFLYNTLGLSSQALIFGWFQKKYQIEQNHIAILSANEQYNQLKDDISLNVATGFLRVLLAREQVKINEAQLKLDNEQYLQTVKFVNAGKLPELNEAQMVAQVSSDSSNLISAMYDERIAMLQLKAIMNFNFEESFDIQAPDVQNIDISNLLNIPSPEAMYNTAVKGQHKMKYNELQLLSANKTLHIAKAAQYPQLSFFGNLGTNFSSNVKQLTGQTYVGETQIGNININGSSFPITTPTFDYTTKTTPLFKQYGNNIRANVGLGLTVPIFNGYTARTSIQKAKIGLVSQQISYDSDKQKLKQDIYTAFEQAKASSQKYTAAKHSQEAAKRALDFAIKRYGIGMINTYEYTSILNSYYTASTSVLSSKYDLIFKLKVLDYYMGNPLKL
jgi:outer membrane protein